MTRTRGFPRRAAACVAAAALAAASGAAQTVDVAEATIEAGAAPTPGAVVVDPHAAAGRAPSLAPVAVPPGIGGASALAPTFAGGGTGALGAFRASSDQTLPGGTYDWTSFVVDPDVTVVFSGAATLRCTGAATVEGRVATSGPDAPLDVRCAGDLLVRARGVRTDAGFVTTGNASPIIVSVGGAFTATSDLGLRQVAIEALSGDVVLDAGGDVTVDAASTVGALDGAVRVRAGGSFALTDQSVLGADAGDVTVHAFRGDVRLEASFVRSDLGDVRLEASRDVLVRDTSDVSAEGTIRVRALGRSVVVRDDSGLETIGGDVVAEAAADVLVSGLAGMSAAGDGDVTVVAHGGDVTVGVAGFSGFAGEPDLAELSVWGRGTLSVHALGAVRVAGMGGLTVDDGSISVRAGDDVVLTGAVSVRASGAVQVATAGALTARRDPAVPQDPPPSLVAASLDLRAGAGGASLDTSRLATTSGASSVVAAGAVVLRGVLESAGDVVLRSLAASVDVSDEVVVTASDRAVSGSILLETWAQPIHASRSTVVSGDAAERSGDVRLLVHDRPSGGGGGTWTPLPPPDDAAEDAEFVVTQATLQRGVLRVEGFAEGGLRAITSETVAAFRIGGLTAHAVAAPTPRRTVRYRKDDFDLEVVPPLHGEGRTRFKLRLRGESLGAVGALASDGPATLSLAFEDAVLAGRAEVVLDRGRFALGRRGRLVVPAIYVLDARAALRGRSRDELEVRAVVALDAAAAAADARLTFGESVSVTAAAGAFRAASGGRLEARRAVPSTSSVVLDPRRQTLTFVAERVDLGVAGSEAVVDAALSVSLGEERRDARVRFRRQGPRLRY